MALSALHRLDAGTVVLALISGGGSALLEAPRAGVTLDDLAQTTDLLLRAGAPITALNAVRAPLSRVKAGGLRAAAPKSVWATLILVGRTRQRSPRHRQRAHCSQCERCPPCHAGHRELWGEGGDPSCDPRRAGECHVRAGALNAQPRTFWSSSATMQRRFAPRRTRRLRLDLSAKSSGMRRRARPPSLDASSSRLSLTCRTRSTLSLEAGRQP